MAVRRLNPLKEVSRIENRSYSHRCQKLITDFGIEESFLSARARMKEHHGVDVNVSAIREITENHAARAAELAKRLPEKKNPSKQLIMEMDGEMVPLVEYEESADCRKTKRNVWAELRIGVVQRHNELAWKYAVSFGNADELGDRVAQIAEKIGCNEETKVHGVGDGALWITEQGERIAGKNYTHLVDLFHLSEYFGKAVTAWCQDGSTKEAIDHLKEMAVNKGIQSVIKKLRKELKVHPEHDGIKACLQYIKNRPGQFEYKKAREQDLPIGSGKVEGSHRHLIQKRLKKPGTWWKRENAAHMADLRTLRANEGWELLWQKAHEKMAA